MDVREDKTADIKNKRIRKIIDTIQNNHRNRRLVKQYPFLKRPSYNKADKRWMWRRGITWILESSDYSSTWLDRMPEGWLRAFGMEMCEEIASMLPPQDGLDEYDRYHILGIKEKYGQLRWEDGGKVPEYFHDMIQKYEEKSEDFCICCGKPATRMSKHWISPYCDDCGPEYEKYERI